MIDVIGGQYGQILTKSSGFDRRLKLTPAGRKILDAAAVPRSVFMANKGSVLSTLYNYSSKPGLPLIITDRGEPVLDILNVGKGRIVRWGCNLEKPHLDFLFKAYRRIINYLLKEPSYRRPSRRPRKVVAVSISPFNYLVGDPARQEVSVTVVDRWGLGLNGLTLRLRSVTKPHLVIEMLQQSPQAREVHFTFRTGLTFRETGKIRMEAFSRGKR
ncbi:MAG: hypothetical protein QW390_03115, partial [Candidatus Bathyarchaeia archaeon]